MIPLEVDDIVLYKSFGDHIGTVKGVIKRIGTSIQLGVNWDYKDKRTFYDVWTIEEKPFHFTTTTANYLVKL